MNPTLAPEGSAPPLTRPPEPTVEGYLAVRGLTEVLAAPLSPEDQVVQSMPDASPTKWHRAHATWFFEEFVLGTSVPGYRWYDEDFGYLFNSYYEAVGPRQPRGRRGMITRPDVGAVAAYREHVDSAMVAALEAETLPTEALALLELGLHHEQQHQELLLMDVQHMLFQNPFAPAYGELPEAMVPAEDRSAPVSGRDGGSRAPGWLAHDGGTVSIGHRGEGFAYDNEGPCHEVLVGPFEMADRLVTCGEWLEFVEDGGYRRSDLWLSDGWHLIGAEGRTAPIYWVDSPDSGWHVYGLAGLRPLDTTEPVGNISYHEADAFARWAGARLPTEAEWEAVAARHWRPAADRLQLSGARWQWTASAYLPYPGFSVAAGAVGEYNGKFMVSQHVLRGGSHATPPGHERLSYRNFFPPASQWAFSGLRLARG